MELGAVDHLLTLWVTTLLLLQTRVTCLDPILSREGSLHPHVYLTTAELIAARGYPVQTHHVITEDGYILEMHRIPRGRSAAQPDHRNVSRNSPGDGARENSRGSTGGRIDFVTTEGGGADTNGSGERRVVFLLHGFLSSSADFVMNDPDQALGFLLADAGYDVWIGNNRGNFYGRRHVSLSPNQTQFWQYSWNEMAGYDLPAMLGYVRNTTGVAKVSYVGHSMGTSLFCAMLHYHPHINSWIRSMAAMAPAAYIYHKHAPIRMLSPYFNKIEKELHRKGIMEILRLTPAHTRKMSLLCGPKSIFNALCIFINFLIAGPNANYIDKEYLPVIVAHTPAGTGLRVFTHLMQLHASHKFQYFDYGEEENMKEYGTLSPPSFSLSRVTVPIGLFWSQNDWIVHPKDVEQMASELPWVALNHKVQLRDFNHLDFLWAENANHLVYHPIMKFLEGFY